MRLVPLFILETHNQTNDKCLLKIVQTENASLALKNGHRRNIHLDGECVLQ